MKLDKMIQKIRYHGHTLYVLAVWDKGSSQWCAPTDDITRRVTGVRTVFAKSLDDLLANSSIRVYRNWNAAKIAALRLYKP